ncbi:MAG: hypothetical protein WCK78_19235 [Paludibacter sp.]
MIIIDGIEINNDKDEILKANPKWGHKNNSWRPELNVEYIIKGVEVQPDSRIGEWEVVILSNNDQTSSISPNYITTKHWIDGEELFMEGAPLKTLDQIKNAIGKKIVFTEEIIKKVDSFSTEKGKMYRPIYKYVLK